MKNRTHFLLLCFSLIFFGRVFSQPPPAGMKLWLRSDAGVYKDGSGTVATANDLIQVWADQSGNGNDFIQPDTGKRPMFKYNVICGQHVLRFDVGRRTFLSSIMRMNGPKTVFIVFKVAPFANAAETLLSLKGNADEFSEIVATDFAGYKPITFIDDLPSTAGGGFMSNSVGIDAGFSSQGNLVNTLYNGGAISNPASYTAGFDNVAVPTMNGGLLGRFTDDLSSIGARAPFQNINFYSGDIGEIIVYDRILNAAEIDQASNYLIYKFGLNNTCIPLYLKLLYFNAVPEKKQVNINWKVAAGMDITRYEVRRSGDGIQWNTIHTMPANSEPGTTTTNFQATDRNPLPGLSYYRIAAYQRQTTLEQSVIRSVYFGDSPAQVAIFPNPSSDKIFLRTTYPETVSVSISDQLGREWKKIVVNTSQPINITSLPAGIYFLRIKGATINKMLRFVRQ